MFENILDGLSNELSDLGSKRSRCEELMGKVQDREKKAKLTTKYDILRHAADRVQLCLDILSYNVSVEVSENGRSVKFL